MHVFTLPQISLDFTVLGKEARITRLPVQVFNG